MARAKRRQAVETDRKVRRYCLEYGQPVPLLHRDRFQKWVIVIVCALATACAIWLATVRITRWQRHRQQLLNAAATAAAEMGDDRRLQELIGRGANINAVDTNGKTALWWTVKRGNRKMAEWLLGRGADPNGLGGGRASGLAVTIENDDLDMAKLLISRGALLNRSVAGQSPLHWAVRKGRGRFVQLFIEHGADVDAAGMWGWRPLHYAVAYNRHECLSLLLCGGAQVGATDDAGQTALDLAIESNRHDLGDLLVKHGANVTPER